MQGPLKASFIVALRRRERICRMRYGDLLALEYALNQIPPIAILETRSCVCCIVCHLFPKSSTAAEIEAILERRSALSGAIRLRAQVVC